MLSWIMLNVCDFLILSAVFLHLSAYVFPFQVFLSRTCPSTTCRAGSKWCLQRAVRLSWGRCLLAPIAPMQNPGSCNNTWVYLDIFRLCSTSPCLYLCILTIVHTADLSGDMRSTLNRFWFARLRLAGKLLPIALSLKWIWWTVNEQILTSDLQYLWQVMANLRANLQPKNPHWLHLSSSMRDVLFITVLFITAQHLGAWCDSVPGESSGSTLYWPSWCCRALLSYYDGSRTHTLTVYDMFMTGQRKHLLAMCVGESPTKIYFKEI